LIDVKKRESGLQTFIDEEKTGTELAGLFSPRRISVFT
jgi:hypothetical protein